MANVVRERQAKPKQEMIKCANLLSGGNLRNIILTDDYPISRLLNYTSYGRVVRKQRSILHYILMAAKSPRHAGKLLHGSKL